MCVCDESTGGRQARGPVLSNARHLLSNYKYLSGKMKGYHIVQFGEVNVQEGEGIVVPSKSPFLPDELATEVSIHNMN